VLDVLSYKGTGLLWTSWVIPTPGPNQDFTLHNSFLDNVLWFLLALEVFFKHFFLLLDIMKGSFYMAMQEKLIELVKVHVTN
jgi:hypothetical protein